MKESMMPSPEDLKRIQEENMSEEQIKQTNERGSDVRYLSNRRDELAGRNKEKINEFHWLIKNEEIKLAEDIKHCESRDTSKVSDEIKESYSYELEKARKILAAMTEFKKTLDSIN